MTPISILIVEDERIIALDLQLQLQSMGYTVCAVVATAALAIQSALELRPDIILMDIHLEGPVDGIDAGSEIHAQWKTPIIFLTAYAEDATLLRAKEALPYGYLVKPVSPRELNATIQMARVRHLAQLQAEESAERLRLALQAALLDVWEWDAQSDKLNIYNLIESNYSALSFPLCEPLDEFYKRLDARDIDNVKNSIEQAKNEGGSINVIFRTGGLSGEVRWIEVHAKRLENRDGSNCKIIGVIQDITERRRNEDRLHQAVVVFESTAEGILILGADLCVVSCNPAFTQLTGYDFREVSAWSSISPLYEQEHSPHFFARLGDLLEGQWQGHMRYRKKDGQTLSAWETTNVVRDREQNICNYVIVFSDISAILAIQEQLEYLAKHDSLTGLYNRRTFLDRLDDEIGKSIRNRHLMAVLLIDLDHFKTINDTLGHVCGDALLQEVAARLVSCVRATDTVARLGGDEFALIVGEMDGTHSADQIAQKILGKLAEPFRLGDDTCYITGSIGIAVAPTDSVDRSTIIESADQAMYAAKKAGRNGFSFFAPFMQKASEMRLKISTSLHEALRFQQFWVAYQPIVDLKNGKIVKAEALLRWDHPVYGAIGPASFIPIAEETGVIQPISDWVFDEVAQKLLRWRTQFDPELQISVNVSPVQFRNKNNYQRCINFLEKIGLPGQAIVIEITEGLLLDANPLVSDCLLEYHQSGIQVSLDDFGTGYSSLSYLKKFDIDYLKIDQSFVKNLDAQSDDLALCEAIIVMAHRLGIKVVAEGLETEEQVRLLTEAGCDFGQGFYFSRPVAATPFAALLEHGIVP